MYTIYQPIYNRAKTALTLALIKSASHEKKKKKKTNAKGLHTSIETCLPDNGAPSLRPIARLLGPLVLGSVAGCHAQGVHDDVNAGLPELAVTSGAAASGTCFRFFFVIIGKRQKQPSVCIVFFVFQHEWDREVYQSVPCDDVFVKVARFTMKDLFYDMKVGGDERFDCGLHLVILFLIDIILCCREKLFLPDL